MPALSYEIHKLTSRLDRAADRLLRNEADLSYSRFLALFAVDQGAETQRQLARWLGQSEPATSRMVGVLAREGLVDVETPSGTGNRRSLRLSPLATVLVKQSAGVLEASFQDLVRRTAIDADAYARDTRRLLAGLENDLAQGPQRDVVDR